MRFQEQGWEILLYIININVFLQSVSDDLFFRENYPFRYSRSGARKEAESTDNSAYNNTQTL